MNRLLNNARLLRQNSTQAERTIWSVLRNRQLKYKFVRQYIIDDKYIVDFICREKKLIIEIDGGQHCDSDKDKKRDEYLKQNGYEVMRCWNSDIMNNLDGCLAIIVSTLEK